MALTKSMCLEAFLQAWSQLDVIMTSPRATDAQVAAAERAKDMLVHDFVRERMDSLAERTALFGQFITNMQAVADTLNKAGPFKAIKDLQKLIDAAKATIVAANAADPPGVVANPAAGVAPG